MKVKLISWTRDAKNLLMFTKNTRLMDDEDAYEKIKITSKQLLEDLE